MSLIGRTLGNFDITGQIGKGGMGEVYRARDRKLERDVAVKVLPGDFARDPDRIARFRREAKLLAALNHPNIASIYGLEEADGTHFLVLELVAGETLAERIDRGRIPVEEALGLAFQIAEAMEAAHEKGVIHRDLKPANIKVTPDGKIKVLDFGLAKAFAGNQSAPDLSDSPTLSDAATRQGIILGTAAYMSPEQARGKDVDRRADIWAFGVMLFEMLAGHAVFKGEDITSTLARVLEREPDYSTLPENLHPRIRTLLERCLKKDARDRYRDIGDVRMDIREALSDPGGVLSHPGDGMKSRTNLRIIIPLIAASVFLTAFAVWKAARRMMRAEPSRPVVRFDYHLPEGRQFSRDPILGSVSIAVSPDGSQFAYSTTEGIYVRAMDGLDARLLPGTGGDASSLFFSPDSQWIGYFAFSERKLKKISVNGGQTQDLCDAFLVIGAKWYEDDTIIYSDLPRGTLRISSGGGTPEFLIKGITGAPQLLPDRKSVLFTDVSQGRSGLPKLIVQSLESKERKVLLEGGSGQYLPTGHLLYSTENGTFIAPFNPGSLEISGDPIPLNLQSLATAWSDSGTLVYVPGDIAIETQYADIRRLLVWVDRSGNEKSISAEPDNYGDPRISPDRTRVALTVTRRGRAGIWIWDLTRENLTPFTLDKYPESLPLWSSDSRHIAFLSARKEDDPGGIYRRSADGTGEEEELGSAPDRSLQPWSWSGDEKTLVFQEIMKTAASSLESDIGILSLDGNRERKALWKKDRYIKMHPAVSPDGKWIAYNSMESGQSEVFVRSFPDVNKKGKWQVSTNGGSSPRWSPDGREIFYYYDKSMISVPVETEPVFKPGKPRVLFSGDYVSDSILEALPWDIHPDGKRFLMLKRERPAEKARESAAPRRIVVVMNWFDELKQRMPKP